MVSEETKLLTVRTALKNMYEKGYVNICCINKCIELMGVVPPREEYEMLSTLHCVDFKSMDKTLRTKVLNSIMVVFSPETCLLRKGY